MGIILQERGLVNYISNKISKIHYNKKVKI